MNSRTPALLALAMMAAATVHAAYHLPPDKPTAKPPSVKPPPTLCLPTGWVHAIRYVM